MRHQTLIVAALALLMVACQGKPQRRTAPSGRAPISKPASTNLHDRTACPPLLIGDWATPEGQKLNLADDGQQMTVTYSEGETSHVVLVDGLVRNENGVTTVAACTAGVLNYGYADRDHQVSLQITTDNLQQGKLKSKIVRGANAPEERVSTLSRPATN